MRRTSPGSSPGCSGRASAPLLDTYEAERRRRRGEPRGHRRNDALHGPPAVAPRAQPRAARQRPLALFRRRVNSGRLAEPFSYAASPGPGPVPATPWRGRAGWSAQEGRLRDRLGRDLVLLRSAPERPSLDVGCKVVVAGAELARRYGSQPRAWLIRPDGHIADSLPLARKRSWPSCPPSLPGAPTPAVTFGRLRDSVWITRPHREIVLKSGLALDAGEPASSWCPGGAAGRPEMTSKVSAVPSGFCCARFRTPIGRRRIGPRSRPAPARIPPTASAPGRARVRASETKSGKRRAHIAAWRGGTRWTR